MAKKNILYIENGAGKGGATISLVNMLWHIDRTKFNPYVICSYESDVWQQGKDRINVKVVRKSSFSKKPWVERLRKKSRVRLGGIVNKIVSGFVVLFDFVFCIIPYTMKMFWITRKQNISLIHLNNMVYENASGILLAKMLGIPCVCHQRGFEWNFLVTRWLAKHIDYYIAISGAIRDDLLRFDVPLEKINIIPEGIALDEFSPGVDVVSLRKQFGLDGETKTFGIIGFLVNWKGQKNFIEAATKVFKKFSNSRAFIIGYAPKSHSDYGISLKEKVCNLGLEDRIYFTGYKNNAAPYYEVLDVVVHASIEPEPFGRVIIEGMAMQKPVIASKLGAPLEIIEDQKTGILVEPNNPDKLVESIIDLLQDRQKRELLGRAGRAMVARKYTIEQHAELMESLYKQIFESKK